MVRSQHKILASCHSKIHENNARYTENSKIAAKIARFEKKIAYLPQKMRVSQQKSCVW
jgi:hypothetical protein